MKSAKFLELLAKSRAILEAAKQAEEAAAAASIEAAIIDNNVEDVEVIEADIPAVIEAVVEAPIAKQARVAGTARQITLNERQQQAEDTVLAGGDTVVIGAAGTGKTTAAGHIIRTFINSGRIKLLTANTKYLIAGHPGAVVVSFTNKAVNNIRYAMPDDLKPHTITIHKLLEYQPVFYEIDDPANPGQFKNTMRFEPTRTRDNPLPPGLQLLVYEESSMIGVPLYKLLQEALPHYHQEVFLGDIQQLPPVFGMAILGFKMLELPVVELTEIYRQAAESPIINLAWGILGGEANKFHPRTENYETKGFDGKPITKIRVLALDTWSRKTDAGEVRIQVWQKKLTEGIALSSFVKQFTTWSDQGYYNPDEDIILCPFGVRFGCTEINLGIAQHLGVKRGAIVHEVIAGFHKHYLAVGDRVLYDKEDAFITSINRNGNYLGKRFQPGHEALDRWGHLRHQLTEAEKLAIEADGDDMNMEAIERYFELATDDVTEKTNAASHVITVKTAYGDEEHVLEDARQVNDLLGGYAITVHKSQGSEYDKVFMVLHHSYAVMLNRELLYTGVTRAKQLLHVICEPDSFFKGIRTQAILGNTLEEKAKFFQGKALKKESFDIKDTYKNGPKERPDDDPEPDPSPEPGTKRPTDPGAVSIVDSGDSSTKTPLVKMHELISDAFKAEANARLDACWTRAFAIWGDKIGTKPRINYTLQRHSVLGRAYSGMGLIALNPVWCLISEESPIAKEEMLGNTLIHELCHIIATRYSGANGHDAGWIMAMQLMGIYDPSVTYDDDTLPSWADAYREVMLRKQEELEAKGVEV